MSTIVWILTVAATGLYGIPTSVRITFDTEAACERARATVAVDRGPVTASCAPAKATPQGAADHGR